MTKHALLMTTLLLFSLQCTDLDNVSITETGEASLAAADSGQGDIALDFSGFDNIDVNQSDGLNDSGYSKEQVDSVRIRSITLDITNPSSSYFNFLDEIVFYISADALPQQEIGRLSPVPSRLTEVELNVSSIDIVDYLLSESMTITTQASGIAPKEALTVRATVDLDVDVDVTAAAGCQVAPY